MKCKFPGVCRCGARVRPGDEIRYNGTSSPKVQGCPACAKPAATVRPTAAPATQAQAQAQAVQAKAGVVAVACALGGAGALPLTEADRLALATFRRDLDPHQSRVADWTKGAALVAAGAGAGKTATIVERIARLIQGGAVPESILALAYNASAAAELRARLAQRLGEAVAARVQAQTFHAWGRGILIAWGDPRARRILGVDGGPKPWPYARAAAQACDLKGDPKGLIEAAGLIREALIDLDADDVVERISELPVAGSEEVAKALAAFTRAYQTLKGTGVVDEDGRALTDAPGGVIDFSDMLAEVAGELRQGTPRALELTHAYAHVLVDEAQDANRARVYIAQRLGEHAVSSMAVGDLRQSIYSFTGARPDLFSDLQASSTLLVLPTNYRSGSRIVQVGNRVAHGQPWDLGGACSARVGAATGTVEVWPISSEGEGAVAIADDVRVAVHNGSGLVDDSGATPRPRYAVLARTRAALVPVQLALHSVGIKSRIVGAKGGIWASPVGSQIRAYLAGADGDAADVQGLTRAANAPNRWVSGRMIQAAVAADRDVRRGLDAIGRRSGKERGCTRLAGDLRTLGRLDWASRCDQIGEWLTQDLADRAADAAEAAGTVPAADEDREALVLALVQSAKVMGSRSAIQAALDADLQASEDSPDVVLLSTIHGAKGAEWSRVYVAAVVDGILPHIRSTDLGEERRLLYVAVTRARDGLVICDGGCSLLPDLLDLTGDEPQPPPPAREPAPLLTDGAGDDLERAEREAAQLDGEQDLGSAAPPDGEGAAEQWPEALLDAPAGLARAPAEASWSITVDLNTVAVETPATPAAPAATPIALTSAQLRARVARALNLVRPFAEVETAATARPVTGRYVPVSASQLLALVQALGGHEAEGRFGQRVYTISPTAALGLGSDGVELLVYSSIPIGAEMARDRAQDSIKVALVAQGDGGLVPLLASQPYACRTRGWRLTLLDRIHNVLDVWAALNFCPDCGSALRERKRRDGGPGFLGCVGYPACRHTQPLPVPTAPQE